MPSSKPSKSSLFKRVAYTAFHTGKLAGEIGINLLKNHPRTAPHVDRIEEIIDEQRAKVDRFTQDFERYFWQWVQELDAESKRVFFPPSHSEIR